MNLTALVRRICAAIGRVYPFGTQRIKTIRRRLLLPRAAPRMHWTAMTAAL